MVDVVKAEEPRVGARTMVVWHKRGSFGMRGGSLGTGGALSAQSTPARSPSMRLFAPNGAGSSVFRNEVTADRFRAAEPDWAHAGAPTTPGGSSPINRRSIHEAAI